MSSTYGVVLAHALQVGVHRSSGKITMAMMNRLTNAVSAKSLPQQLVPSMRSILHLGLHQIMLLALLLLIIALVVAILGRRGESSQPVEIKDV